MKIRLTILLIALTGILGLSNTRAAVDVSAGLQINATADFYDPLTPYGSWVEIGSYGRCWHPAHVEADWQPYTEGHWEWTDAGWYWASDEQWAWATYHYGNWVNDPNYGWCWIPGTEWAPSWVVWRESNEYIGWAPCGPASVVIAPAFFVFVDIHHFHDHLRRGAFIRNDTTIIQKTKIVNKFRHEDRDIGGRTRRIAINEGPSVQRIQSATGTTFKPQPVQTLIQQTPVPETLRQRQSGDKRSGTTQPGSVEQPRERTGGDQQRTYQQPPANQAEPKQTQPERQQPASQPEHGPEVTTPREPASPPDTREQKREPKENLPPTGPSQSRTYREVPAPNAPGQRELQPQPSERQREVPAPAAPERIAPQVPNERPLPPTGREKEVTVPAQKPQVVPPRQPPVTVPERPQAVPPGQEKDRERDKDKDHP